MLHELRAVHVSSRLARGLRLAVAGVLTCACAAAAQQDPAGAAAAGTTTLSPQDYIDIQQLVAQYAYAIDNCTNNGYDYADLYAPDGWFATLQNGRTGTRWQGRDRLAEAARGGMKSCDDVPWNGISHMLVNHVISPSPGGATGKVYLVAIGLDGDPQKVEAQGHYEDVYVKTPEGWRFKSRLHVLRSGQEAVSRGSKPAAPAR
jgi:hypothetical protein